MGEVILSYIFQGVSLNDLPSKFMIKENPTGVSRYLISEVCIRVLGETYSKIIDHGRKLLISVAVLATNPQSVNDVTNYPGFWIPSTTANQKLKQFFVGNRLVQYVLNRGVKLNALDTAKVALIGNQLLTYYQVGYSDQQILDKLGPSYSIADIRELTNLIWGMTPDNARRAFYSHYLNI